MTPAPLQVDDQRIVLPDGLAPEETYDVLLNDLHVWSLTPDRDAKQGKAGQEIAPRRAHQRRKAVFSGSLVTG